MSKLPNSPYVEASQIIDTDQNKPYELIHQRYFNNVIIKSGWKASADGLFNYYLDVKLPVKSGEAPITLAYSPEIIIPENANTTCRPSNFPYARTVGVNTVRIYAIQVPKSTDMLPVVIHMRAVGTSEGTTNSRPETGGSDIRVDRYSFQATGTNFYVEVDEDNKTVKQEKLTVTVMAFKGEKRIEPYLQDTKLTELVYNLDGTLVSGIPAAVPTTIITDPKNPTKSMTITIPKGTILKDRQAYITFGVTGIANTGFTYTMRAVIYTNLSDKNVSTSFIYDVKMPFFSRKTSGNVYYADGEVVSALNGYDLQVTATTLNNEVSQPNGSLKLYKVSGDTKTLIKTLTVSAGEVNLNPSALFDGVRDFEYEFVVSGAVVYQNQSTITQHGDEIILRTDPQYVIPTIVNTPEGEKFEVPSIRVTSSFIGPTGLFVDYHGFFVIKTSDGESIYDSVAAESRVNTPIKQYVQSELPGSYVIELYEVKPTSGAAPMARAFVSIPREGETELPYIMDLSPNSLVIPTSSDNEIGQSIDFAATILRGVTDVSGDWNFSIATPSETLESYGIEITQNLNIFTLVQFSGPQLSAVIKIKAQNKEDSTLVYNKDIVFAKLRENDDMGNYTFTRYGELNDEGEIVFTTDPMDQVGPGIVAGPFIGIATSNIQEVPPASEFKWLPVDQQGNQGEPGETAAAFYIDGRGLVKASVVNGEVLYSPFSSNYSIEKWYDGVNDPVSIEWSVTTSNKDIGLYTSVMGNLLELTFSEVFDMTDEINITATIQVEIDGEIVTYRATKDVFLIYSDQNEYFSKQDGLNIPQDHDYTFEIDKNGNAFKGVAKSGNPVKIGFESYKGNTKLQYNPDLLNIDRLDFEETGDIEVELPQVGGYTFEDLSGSWASYGGTWEQLSLYGDESQGGVLGRNYILDSAEIINFSELGDIETSVQDFEIGGRNCFSLIHLNSISPSSWVVNAYVYNFDLEPNTEYILSSNVPTDGNSSETVLYFNGGGTATNGVWLDNPKIMETDDEGKFFIAIPTGRTYANDILNGTYWVQLQKGNTATDWTPAPEDLQHAHTYNLSTPIQSNTKYQLHTSNYEDDWYGVWLGEDYFAGYLEEGHLEIDVDFTVNEIIIKSLKGTSISHIKLEPGSTKTPYTPALEDFIYARQLPLTAPALPGEDYFLSLVSDDWVAAWLGTDRFLGFVREGGLQIIFEEEKVPLEQRDKVILKVFNKDAVIRGISLRNTFQSEYFYYLDNLLAEGAVVRPIINGNDLAIEFVDIISRSGYIDTTLRMNGHLKTHRFIFNTIVTANNKPPQVSLQLSNSVIKINNATVKDMQNWDDTMAASYSDSFENSNSPITLLPEVRNTNIDSIWYSKNGQNYLQFSYESQYVGVPTEEEEFAPILPLNLYYDWKEYIGSAFVTAEKYYLLIIERDDSVDIDFFANNEILHSKEITQNNYYIPGESTNGSYTGKKVVLIKAPAGAEIIKVKQGLDGIAIPEGEQGPYAKPPELFYLQPPARTLRELDAATYDSGLINMDAFKAQVGESQIYRYLPVGHILPEGSLISIETQPNGTGYFVIDPKIAANPNFFDNTHTDTHSSIKVNVVDDESSYSISISRSIAPYNDLDQIRSDLKDSLNGEWFYHSDLSGLKRTLAALLETKDEILEQLAEDEVFITIAEEDPVAARAEILFPEREELVGNEFIKVQGEYSLNIFQESITDPSKKVNSVFGTTVHEDNSYILRFKLSHSLSGNQTVGTKFVDMLNGDEFELDLNDIPQAGKVFEFFIPKLGGELTEAIQTYLGKHGFSNQPLVLADRDRKIPQKYTTYYMRFTNENVTEKNQLIMSDFEFKQIKPETEIRNPKYEGIDPQNMVTLVSGFESRVNSLESALNLSEDNRIEVPSDIYQDYVDIEKEIKNLRILISKQLRDSFDKAIFQTYQGADSYTIGFNTASEWLSSLTVSSEGTLMRGDHHQIIGSASIGTLYGKKFVIGKTPDARDINFDKTYDGDGLIAIWEDDELSGGRWSSLLDSDGHQFYRYEIQEGNINAIRGYMIMNSTEIAAYQLDEAYYDISDTMPPKLLDRSAQAIFKIKDNGSVAINQLEISGRGASANFMETIQFMRYERGEEGSEDNKKRRGMVIIGIGGEN